MNSSCWRRTMRVSRLWTSRGSMAAIRKTSNCCDMRSLPKHCPRAGEDIFRNGLTISNTAMNKPKLICPMCGAEMNHHAMKIDYNVDDALIDPAFEGVL